MSKNKSLFISKSSKILALSFKTIEFLVFAAVLALFFIAWQKPYFLAKFINLPAPSVTNLDDIKSQMAIINKDMVILSNAIMNEQEKFAMLKENIAYFDKSKADLSEITNIDNRLYDIERQTKLLSQRSNNAALVLNMAMLIRDNISKGLTCQKEAEGLKILAADINSISEDVEFIASHCYIAFMSNNSLINNFNNIYADITKPNIENDWKKRLTSKIGEYVKISTPDSKNSVQEVDLNKVLENVKVLVNNQDFSAAATVLSNSENSALLNDKRIYNWYQQSESQLKFYKSLSNIINNALLLMKVEDAQNTTE